MVCRTQASGDGRSPLIPAVAKSQVGHGSFAAPARLGAKADEILKMHRDAAKVAKARKLSPTFDAECREAERPKGFWQWAGYIHGVLRHDGGYVKVLLLAGMIWFLIKIAAFLWLMVKALAVMVPVWLMLALFGDSAADRRRRASLIRPVWQPR